MQNTQLDELQTMGWFKFELLTKSILLKEGYDKAFITHKGIKGGDDGVDVIAEKNGERFAIQCKRWTKNHKLIDQIRALGGSLKKRGLEHGLFFVSIEANDYELREAKSYGIELWDCKKILEAVDRHELAIEHKKPQVEMVETTLNFKQNTLKSKQPHFLLVLIKFLLAIIYFLVREFFLVIAEILSEILEESKPKKKRYRKRRYSY